MAWIKSFEDPETGDMLMKNCSLEETRLGAFLRARTCAGQGTDSPAAHAIIEADQRLFSALDQMLVMTETKINKEFPDPTVVNPKKWTAAVEKRWLIFEYIRFRLEEMKTLPHLQPKPKPAP